MEGILTLLGEQTREWTQRMTGRLQQSLAQFQSLAVPIAHDPVDHVWATDGKFTIRDPFLNEVESDLLRLLISAVGSQALICPKVRATDLLSVPYASRNMDSVVAIDRKSVSFLICDPVSFVPKIVATAAAPNRQHGGRSLTGAVEKACLRAGLPVMIISPTDCSVDELRENLLAILKRPTEFAQPRLVTDELSQPRRAA